MTYAIIPLIFIGILGMSGTKERYIDVNFSKPSSEKRLTVVENGDIIYRTWVSHGRESGELYAKSFSNVPNSNKSSLGKMRVGQKYYGKHGLSYRLIGLETGINDNVEQRAIVIHSADYIGYGKTGRSLGCLAIPTKDYADFLKYVKPGMEVRVHL